MAELPRSVVLVEGTSDQVAVETLAERREVSLVAEGVEIVPIGGAHAIGRFLAHFGPLGVPLAGLYDAAEAREFAAPSETTSSARGFFACDPDLEGELIRALGADAVEAVAEATATSTRSARCRSSRPGAGSRSRSSCGASWAAAAAARSATRGCSSRRSIPTPRRRRSTACSSARSAPAAG